MIRETSKIFEYFVPYEWGTFSNIFEIIGNKLIGR